MTINTNMTFPTKSADIDLIAKTKKEPPVYTQRYVTVFPGTPAQKIQPMNTRFKVVAALNALYPKG